MPGARRCSTGRDFRHTSTWMKASPCSHASSRRSSTTDSRSRGRRARARGGQDRPFPSITSRSGGKPRPPPLPRTPPSPTPPPNPRGALHLASHATPSSGEPGAALLHQAALAGEVEQFVWSGDAHAVEDVEFRLAEGRGELVLHHLHPRARADHLIAFLDRADAADVQAQRGIELQGVPSGGGLRRAEDDADLHADLVDEDHRRPVAAHHRGELAQRLRHEPRLEAHVLIAHLALDLRLGYQRCDRVDDHHVDRAAANQGLRNFESLLSRVGLRDEQLLDLHPELLRVAHVERVLRVDEGGAPALRLHLCDGVQRQRGLAARLRAVDLDDTAAWIPAASQRDVEPQRAALDHRDRLCGAVVLAQAHDGALAELLLDGADGGGDGLELLGDLAHVPSGLAPDDAPGEADCSAASRARWRAGSAGPSRPWTGRSRQRYWTASSTCLASMPGCSSRSAMVRASFSTRSWARADSCRLSIAAVSAERASLDGRHSSLSVRPRSCAFA